MSNSSSFRMSQNVTRRGFLGMALAAGAATLAACSSNSGSSSDSASGSNTAPSSGNDTSRVVVLNTGQLDNMLLLGILPVGSAKAKGAELIPEFISKRFGSEFDLSSIKDCGVRTNPDMEAIAALKPTLICANDRTDEAILEQLRKIATVVTGSGGGENWKEDFVTIADAVGKKSEAETLLKEFEESCKTWGESLGDKAPTVSFLRTKDDAFQIFGAKSMAGIVAADCLLNRPESQQFTEKAGKELSAEQLKEADADWLFYAIQDGGNDPTKTSTWSTLKSVQDKQAIEVDYDAWYVNASYLSATIIRDGLKEHIGS